MKNPRLEELINRYYEGNTSSAEEKELEMLFDDHCIQAHHSEKALFAVFAENRNASLASNFEEKLEIEIGKLQKAPANHISGIIPLSIAASLIVLILFAYWAVREVESKAQIVTTATEPAYIELPDGSRVWLNKESTLTYALNFAEKREVDLEGEGFFEVVHKPSQPFVISAANTKTEVLGTALNVRSYRKENVVEILVVHGKVAFSTPDDPESKTVLKKDGKIDFSLRTGITSTSHIENQNLIAWKTRALRFNDEELNKVISEIERYAGINIESKNKNILKCHYTGMFQDASTEEILSTLSYSLDLNFEEKDGLYTLSGEGCPETK